MVGRPGSRNTEPQASTPTLLLGQKPPRDRRGLGVAGMGSTQSRLSLFTEQFLYTLVWFLGEIVLMPFLTVYPKQYWMSWSKRKQKPEQSSLRRQLWLSITAGSTVHLVSQPHVGPNHKAKRCYSCSKQHKKSLYYKSQYLHMHTFPFLTQWTSNQPGTEQPRWAHFPHACAHMQKNACSMVGIFWERDIVEWTLPPCTVSLDPKCSKNCSLGEKKKKVFITVYNA